MNFLEGFFTIFAGLLVFFIIAAVIEYIIQALFLNKIADEYNLENKWMSWVPILNTYYFGKVAGAVKRDEDFIKKYTALFLGNFILTFITQITIAMELSALSGILTFVLLFISIGYFIYYFIGLYGIYQRYCSSNAIILLILSIFIPFAQSIITIYLLLSKIGKEKIE